MDPALKEFLSEPWRFEFTQAMRVLLRNSGHGENASPIDRRFDAAQEPARIGANQSLAFPASDIQELSEPVAGSKRQMLINFLGLTGPSGVLPVAYTEFLMGRDTGAAKSRIPAEAVEFLDIFNHRMAMMFYYAWEKYRFPVVFERRAEQDLFPRILLSLVGLGTEFLQKRQAVDDTLFARYASAFAVQPRSASALEGILCDFFDVPIAVEQFAGAWYQLDEESTTRFEDGQSESEMLGYGVVVSNEYWSQEFMVRLRIGPLDLDTYRKFLRGGAYLDRLNAVCRFFSRSEFVFEAQLILRKEQVPDTILSAGEDPSASQLGWTTWAKSAALEENPGDVIMRLS